MRRRQTAAIVITVGHRSTLQSRVTVAVGYASVSRSVSSREVRLHDQDELDCTLPCASVHSASREMSRGDGEKEARRNIYGMVTVVYTDSAAASAQARPNYAH